MFGSILYMISALYLWIFISDVLSGTPTSEECSRSFLGREGHGVITSYNYPFDYLHNLTCTYSIVVTSDLESTNIMCLLFRRFSLETSTPFCSFDYLKLEYPELKYCASGLWMYGVQTTAPGSNVWSKDFCWTVKNTRTFDITFSSDNNINAAGFYAEYFIFPGENENVRPPGNLGQAPCAVDEWTCFNRRCIAQSLLCDGSDNCGDNSDETYVHARCGEQNVLACDFTTGSVSDGYCGFTHEGWFRTREPNSPYGPQGDHTNGSSGYYVYSDVNQSSAFLLSPELSLPRNKSFCLSFWYYLYGRPAAATLRVYVTRDQAYSRPEWSRSRAPDAAWVKGEIAILSQADIQIIFEAELDNSFSGVALDDVSILPGSCQSDDVSCNFESGPCGWQPLTSLPHLEGSLRAGLTWKTHARLLGSAGPAWDQSSKDGGGHYLLLSHSGASTADNRALLRSRPISGLPGNFKCFQFWYHLDGQDRDCCHIQVRILDAEDRLREAVWSKTGEVRRAWNQAYVSLNLAEPFQIVIEGMVSSTAHSEIALDQLVLSDGLCVQSGGSACEAGHYLCADGACVNATGQCDGRPDCLDSSDEDWRAGCTTPGPAPPPPTNPTRPPSALPPTTTCPPGTAPCRHGNACIPADWFCDHYSDCLDRSDESSLSGCSANTALQPCREGRYLCQNGRCIHGYKRCDGSDNCGDNSDEVNCQVTTAAVTPACARGHYLCVADHSCIPDELRCDGSENCADGSDESIEHAGCTASEAVRADGLATGEVVGIVLGCIVCLVVIVLSAVLGRRRRKHQPRRRAAEPSSPARPGISTISEPSSLERHMSMLEAIRAPMRELSGLPPYSEQNMGYTSDGTVTLGRAGLGMVFPPEEPPPPYDSVVKDNTTSAPAGDIAGPSTDADDESYGFRSRPSSGRHRRKSRERTPLRSQVTGSTPDRELPMVVMSTRVPSEPSIEMCIPHPSDESDTANIYEELNVPTLRPTRVRQEPSSTLHSPPVPGLPPSGFQGFQCSRPIENSAVDTTLPHPPIRSMPRIRLGTQALQSRQGLGTTRPLTADQEQRSTMYNQPGSQSLHGSQSNRTASPASSTPTGDNSSQRHRDFYQPGAGYNTTGDTTPQVQQDLQQTIAGCTGRRSQRQPANTQTPSHNRLYGSDRNPSRNYATQASAQTSQHDQVAAAQTSPSPSRHQSVTEPNPALSVRAMPDPRTYAAGGSERLQPASQGSQSPLGRDWHSSSLTSAGSQENLISSPPGVGLASRYPNHLRDGSNISSDMDSTSPLVSGRDLDRSHDNSVELELLTPTSV